MPIAGATVLEEISHAGAQLIRQTDEAEEIGNDRILGIGLEVVCGENRLLLRSIRIFDVQAIFLNDELGPVRTRKFPMNQCIRHHLTANNATKALRDAVFQKERIRQVLHGK